MMAEGGTVIDPNNASSEIKGLKKGRDQMEQEMEKIREKMKKMEIAETDRFRQRQEEKRKSELSVQAATLYIPLEAMVTAPILLVKPSEDHIHILLTSSYDVKLNYIKGFTVMKKTGKVVVKGLRGDLRPFMLYVYSLYGLQLVHEKLRVPCKHKGRVGLLSLVISEIEYLAISCSECRDIKLLNLQTSDVINAYSGEEELMRMCEGEGKTVFVEASHGNILELDCTQTVFSKTKIIKTQIDGHLKGICYIPAPHRLLVVCTGEKVVALACDSGKMKWKRKYRSFYHDHYDPHDPHGLSYSETHNAIFIADGFTSRILVLEPPTGYTRQIIDLPGMGHFRNMCLNGSKLVLRHNNFWKKYISFFSVY